jgi:hypothetical protein
LIRMLAMMQRKMRMKPRMRVAQAKPIWGMSDWSMRGKTTPPNAPPDAAIPVAFPRFLWK